MNASKPETPRDACPFLKFPCRSCYCLEVERLNIERVMNYCAGNYLACTVFREFLNSRTDLKELVGF